MIDLSSIKVPVEGDDQPCSPECNCYFGGAKTNPRGPVDSPIVIVGEAPGPVELYKRTTFTGPSGTVIADAIKAAYDALGIPEAERIEPYYTNAIQCFPRHKDLSKLEAATRACQKRLIHEITKYPRRVIITLGNAATWSVLNDFTVKITRIRGTRFETPYASNGVVAAVHPAFLLRGQGNLPQFKSDFQYAIALAHEAKHTKADNVGKELSQLVHWEVVDCWEKADRLRQKMFAISSGSIVAHDIETSSFSYRRKNEVLKHYGEDGILCHGIYFGEIAYIVEQGFYGNYLFPDHLKHIWHNGKFDVKFFWHRGMLDARIDEDTMLQSYTLNERRGIHDLDQVASDHLGTPDHKSMLEAHLPKKGLSYANIPKHVLYEYLAYDVYKTYHINSVLRPRVAADGHCEKLYSELLIPASSYLAEIEMNGMLVDVEWTERNKVDMTLEADKAEANMNSYAREITGHDVNPRSPKQLQELLYTKLKLAPSVRPTDVDTLLTLPQHPIVVNLLKYRKVHKALSTYVLADLENMEDDGKVHTTYLLHGTATGRLASRNPNKQNVPRDPKIRGQIVAEPGFVFIEPDLNQAELRSLACMSGDEELVRIYNTEGLSLHDEVRDAIFTPVSSWTSELREKFYEQFNVSDDTRCQEEQKMIAKNVNFGIVYGITPYGLSDQIERPVGECEKYIQAWFDRFPEAKAFIDRCMEAARKNEDIITPYGRKKRSALVSFDKLRDLQNEAANFPHQATASDFVLDTGIRIRHHLKKEYKTTIHNTVHDSILLMTPFDLPLIKEVSEYVTYELSQTPKRVGMTRVPFKADAKIGDRWGHLIGAEKWFKKMKDAA